MKQLNTTFDMVHDTGDMFRSLLEAVSNPGRTVTPKTGEDLWLAVAVTVLDGETSFCWNGDPEDAKYLQFMTGARPAPVHQADFVFLPDTRDMGDILASVKQGTHQDPHQSATVFAAAGGEPIGCALKGPGVKPGSRFFLPGEIPAWMDRRDRLPDVEYPCGVDLFFLTPNGITAIPRLVKREVA